MSDKKITLIENEDLNTDVLETLIKTVEAMDWKLWELYQTAQRVETYLGITKNEDDE